MKAVSGFLAIDGKFFEHFADCELYESGKALSKLVDSSLYAGSCVASASFLEMVVLFKDDVARYIEATEAHTAFHTLPKETEDDIIVVTPSPKSDTTITGQQDDRHSKQAPPQGEDETDTGCDRKHRDRALPIDPENED